MKKTIDNILIKEIAKVAAKNKTNAYIVGGYVRDFILNIECNDFDIMVIGDAVKFAEQCAKHFKTKLSAIYKRFGTALLKYDNYKIEFSSARKESYDKKSRKPKIEFADLKDDIERRDFTINAIAVPLNQLDKKIDLFNGLDDIKNKIIRTPIEPDKTFYDDPLRILRAIRFATRLNFSIEEKTFQGIIENKNRLTEDKVVSKERISNEFLMMLEAKKPSNAINLMYLSGVLEIIFPEIAKLAGVEQRDDYHHKDAFYHTLEVLDKISEKTENVWLRFTALVHDIAKPKTKKFIQGIGWTFHGHDEIGARMMKKIFEQMKFPYDVLPYIEKLIRLHLRPIPLAQPDVTDSAIRRLAADAGEQLEDLLTLCKADITSKNPDKQNRFMKNYEKVERRIIEVQQKDNLRNFQSPVRGEEIMEICNLMPSKEVGIIKKKIEEAILEGIIPNEYTAAKEYLYSIKDEVLRKEK